MSSRGGSTAEPEEATEGLKATEVSLDNFSAAFRQLTDN